MKRTGGVGFVTVVVLALSGTPALAGAPHHHHHRVSALGGSCVGSASAIAQYCEDIPGAGGGHHPGPGTPTLSATLPAGAVIQIAHSPSLRPLLRIPAAQNGRGAGQGAPLTAPGRAAGTGASTGGASGADAASLLVPLILVLAAIALLLGGLETARRRRISGRLG
jgi:hypothetical protein